MTSEPSAAPTTLTPGLSAFLTVGERIISIGWMDSGRLGSIQGRGSFEELLSAISGLYGRHGEYMRGTYRVTIRSEQESPQDSPLSDTLDMFLEPTEPKKPESTSTSESQNEEMG